MMSTGSPLLEKRSLLSVPGLHSPLRALFPVLFKNDSSSPSQSGHSSVSSPTTGSPMLRGMSALLKKPSISSGDETKILMRMIKFISFKISHNSKLFKASFRQ